MKPGQRLFQALSAATVALALLSACRREVPPPPSDPPMPKTGGSWAPGPG